jgi:hypothetical protein
MPEFKRYRDEHGHEFTSALAEPKPGWKDITSKDEPALDRDGTPRAAKPASRERAAAVKKVSTTSASGRPSANTEGA